MEENNQEKLIELKEYSFVDVKLNENEIEFIKNLKNKPIELETLSEEKIRPASLCDGRARIRGNSFLQPLRKSTDSHRSLGLTADPQDNLT